MNKDQDRTNESGLGDADGAQIAPGRGAEANSAGAAAGAAPRSKVHTPPRMAIREAPPKAHGLPSRRVLLSGATILGGLVAFALVTGLSPRERSSRDQTQRAFRPALAPESVRNGPIDYTKTDAAAIEDAVAVDLGADLTPPADPQFAEIGGSDLGVSGRGVPPEGAYGGNKPVDRGSGVRGARLDDNPAAENDIAARTSPITFGGRLGRVDKDDMTSPSRLKAPASAYVLQAGSVIPAALRTALNSESPGRVIAQVIAPVYDSLTGEHLLVPQGARLLGTYESGVRYGERRIRIVWNRLILPNGYALDLLEMAAVDQGGAAGLSAGVDNHIGRVAAASVISGALSTAANAAQDRESSMFAQSVGDAAAQEAARAGGRIIDRELDARPTLRVPAGAKIKVLIERDLVLKAGAR